MTAPLTTDLDDPKAVPYFLWDEPMTMAELRRRIAMATPAEWARLLGKVMREARDTDVWRFTTPQEVSVRWGELSRHLGRTGLRVEDVLPLAQRKDGGLTPAQLSWVLSQISISDQADLPAKVPADELRRYLSDLQQRLGRPGFPG